MAAQSFPSEWTNPSCEAHCSRPVGHPSTSPCKNTGDRTILANVLPADAGDLDWDTNTVEPTPKDLARFPRIRLGTVDMGAYELFSDAPPDGGN